MQNVSFRYNTNGPLILNQLSLTIQPGEWVAIVGPSGAGKSTLFKLLLGFDGIDSGSITFDDTPLSQLNIHHLRKQIGVVLQNSALMPGSLLENLQAVNPALSEADMWTLLERVGLMGDVQEMPMGLHTIIMGDGKTFSGGQKQRLALARCLAKPHPILLLDEATSALDNINQDITLQTLKHLTCTRIMIAHRMSTIVAAHRIIVIDQGTVQEQGTYDELIQKKGVFYHMKKG